MLTTQAVTLAPPCKISLAVYPVRVENGVVLVGDGASTTTV